MPGGHVLLLAVCWITLEHDLADVREAGIVPEPLLLAWQAGLEQFETAFRRGGTAATDDAADEG